MSVTFRSPGLSDVVGDADSPLLHLQLHELFERSESCCKVLVITQERSLTYDEIGVLSRSFAANLRKLGFKRGDRLGVWLSSRWEYVVTLIGCSYGEKR